MTKICEDCEEPEERHSWSFKKVPCKKFEPQETLGVLKPNHSPSEERSSKGEASGGDSPEETFSNEKETSGTLSSSLFKCAGFDVLMKADIKDFIQKLKDELYKLGIHRSDFEPVIDELAGASLTGLAKNDLV